MRAGFGIIFERSIAIYVFGESIIINIVVLKTYVGLQCCGL